MFVFRLFGRVAGDVFTFESAHPAGVGSTIEATFYGLGGQKWKRRIFEGRTEHNIGIAPIDFCALLVTDI